MRIFLIRHGRQASRLCNVNVDLSEAGYRQAALLGERLAPVGIGTVYSSDLLRAVLTAQTANLYWNAPHVVKTQLREIDFGLLEGLSDREITEGFPDFLEQQARMETMVAYPGGESPKDVKDRVMPILEEIVKGRERCVAVVTHGGVIRTVVATLFGMDLADYRRLGCQLENCGITELLYDGAEKRFYLERFNDYGHLEREKELLRSQWK